MSLKQSVVIVNEYSVPLPGGGGSRGGTPGQYIQRYMARRHATETVHPIRRRRIDDYIQRYMARDEAVESVEGMDQPKLRSKMREALRSGGVSFSKKSASLSDDELRETSEDIQDHFDRGHTSLNTVISFDQEYLRDHGLVDEDFVVEKRGDYRGHLDQMKLRMAIMRGLERMEQQSYDDLRYVGVIQVDTKQVHCHLSMIDAGRGQIHHDGTQRGKISERSKNLLRRGLDGYLDQHQHVAHLSSAVGYERRNVTTYIKRWAHEQVIREALPQFLLATLPDDRSMWRADTNRREMAKPNRIVREMVAELLEREDSPMSSAMDRVYEYADHRQQQEDLDFGQRQRLVDTGRERIVDRGVNAVYSALRQMPEDMLEVRTPMLDVMSMDYQEVAARAHESTEDPKKDIVGFGFRLRSYSARMQHHDQQRRLHHDRCRLWEAKEVDGSVNPDSRPLYDFYQEEERYHAKVSSKYRHFLNFTPASSTWYDRWEEVSDYGERMLSLESMTKDASIKRMKDPDEAEDQGLEVYGQRGGHLVAAGDDASRAQLADRVRRMRQSYHRKIEDLRVELASEGLVLQVASDDQGKNTALIDAGVEHDFDEVKGLDLHHMRYDFSRDVEVGPMARRSFVEQARRRQQRLDAAVKYLVDSRQPDAVSSLPTGDISAMSQMAQRVSQTESGRAVLPSQVAELARQRELTRRSKTVRLTSGISSDFQRAIGAAEFVTEPEQGPEKALGEDS